MLNPTLITFPAPKAAETNFWFRILNNEQLRDCDDLEKLVVGCEIIAALDAVELLAA